MGCFFISNCNSKLDNVYKKDDPLLAERKEGLLKCFHNGKILIVDCFKLYGKYKL